MSIGTLPDDWKRLAWHLFVIMLVTNMVGCAAKPCYIVPPEKSVYVQQASVKVAVSKLEPLISQKSEFRPNFSVAVTETFRTIPDSDIACALMLGTLACMDQKGSPTQDFYQYLDSTKSCTPVASSNVSIDNLVQVYPAKSNELQIEFDLFVRNAGDIPALLTQATIYTDEHLRPERAPADEQRVSAIYAVVLQNGVNANYVEGAGLNSPVFAKYPSPGSPVLIIEVPIAQRLPARSTDRFRVILKLREEFERRGPLETLRVILHYDGVKTVSSRTIKLSLIKE
ncbi:hypothetical protein CGJ08_14920 [Vibrio parahaemolyticus]|nr:hypothetical protein CGJ08_14920 [Vibrio parahaemolyticus]TOP34930.1 hypothetical protein CGH19_03065 [Vibrio parahaemolyticus]TOQ90627.1 hypothetical protein CGG87_05720 [Vibrio parahaemolyticus]